MTASPACQFYWNDWLSSQRVQLLSLEEEGAYIRLLGYCWKNGSIPSNPQSLSTLIGKGASILVATRVATMFQPHATDETRLVHDRLDAEKEKQKEWREKSSKGGKNSAKTRMERRGALRVVEGCLESGSNQNATLLLSTSSKEEVVERKSKRKAETAEEVEEFSFAAGAVQGEGIALFDKFTGNGWTNGGKPIKDWKATVRNWIHRGYIPKRQVQPESQASRFESSMATGPMITLPPEMKAALNGEEITDPEEDFFQL